jgi:hypothetical protein
MKRCPGVVLLLVLFGFVQTVGAQETSQWAAPRMEVYAGYDYLRVDVTTESNGVYSHPVYNLNGGGGQLIYNLNNWLGVTSELDGYALISGAANIQPALMTYLGGPRFTLRRGRISPYVHTLFGGAFSKDDITNAGYTSRFGMAIGGGADVRVNRRISVRPLQAEYFLMRFPDGASNRQNGFRYSTGVVFRLGR